MIVKEIRWMDYSIREAIVLVSDGCYSVVCFSHPCNYSMGEHVEDLLFCLDAQDVMLADQDTYMVSHGAWEFPHKIRGRLCDSSRGIVSIGDLKLQIDASIIPGDIKNGQFIQFSTARIDLYQKTRGRQGDGSSVLTDSKEGDEIPTNDEIAE